MGLIKLASRSGKLDIKENSPETHQPYLTPKFEAQLKALEEYIMNFIEDSRALERATRKLKPYIRPSIGLRK